MHFSLSLVTVLAALGLSSIVGGRVFADSQTGKWGDQGDGTYRNPIIAADYSDPDVIRVGDTYYMVASTFETSPGVSVLSSHDLVNWRSLGGVMSDLSKIGPDFNWDRMNRSNEGIFAPSIRYHDGKFWVFVNSHSGEGFYSATATNAAGPWTVTQIKDMNGKPLRVGGWTDPCPFWDQDGQAYLASSHPSAHWYSHLFRMTPDGTQLLDADATKMGDSDYVDPYPSQGTVISPFHSSEGNKLYKRNGYYYLMHIEFTDQGQGAGTYVFRSKNLYGTKPDGTPGKPGDPGKYDVYKLGPVTRSGQEIPGQGGLVDTPDGRWFLVAQFNRYGSDGRTPNLLPVTWIDDWPVPGVNIEDNHGKFATQLPKPIVGFPIELPLGSDDFSGTTLSPQWMWNHQPRADKWSLTERPGHLRLHAFQPLHPGNFFSVGNVINQRRMKSDLITATVKLDLAGMADGEEAGLSHFNERKSYANLGVVQANDARSLVYTESGTVTVGPALPAGTQTIWLRSAVTFDDQNAYSYSLDGTNFIPFGGAYKVRGGGYRGDFIGLYTFNPNGEFGFVDVDSFRYESTNR